jgi:hypothetical protein
VSNAELHRQLANAFDDVTMWRNLVALLPWTVHVDHEARRAHERAMRLLGRIPTQRLPLDLRSTARSPRR